MVTCLLCLRKAVYHLISDNKTRWVKPPFVILTMDKLLQCLPCCVSFEKRQYLIPLRLLPRTVRGLYADRGTHACYTLHFEHVPSWVCLTFAIVFFPGCRGAWCNSNQYMPIVDLRFWKGHTQVSPKCLIIGCWLVSFNDSRNRNMSLHILIASPHVIFCGWTSGWIFSGAFQACAAVACVHAVLSVVSCVCCVVWQK